jgi:exopolysaccharide biosynthesis protein
MSWATVALGISAQPISVSVDGKTLSLQVVRVPLDHYRVKVGIAHNRIGAVESLSEIATRSGAIAAINGSFFEAYTSSPIKPPNHHLIVDGNLVHLGNVGTTLGFDVDGDYRMERLHITIRGGVDGKMSWPNNWYAYTMNRPISNNSAAAAYTDAWTDERCPGNGTSVLIRRGHVEAVANGSLPRPTDGMVIVLAGQEQQMANRFKVGRQCNWFIEYQAPDPVFWEHAQDALACGPRLVASGQISVNPEAEGFRDPKILSASCQRSAVGITRDRTLLLVTCTGASIRQLAQAMRALGAYDAMNLDGGASSGLWANGRYLTAPGRNISNALVVVKR